MPFNHKVLKPFDQLNVRVHIPDLDQFEQTLKTIAATTVHFDSNSLHVEIIVDGTGPSAFHDRLNQIIGQLNLISSSGSAPGEISTNSNPRRNSMPLSTAEQAIIDRFNTATSAVAQKIRDLMANPPADDVEFNVALSAIADGLDALGAPAPAV